MVDSGVIMELMETVAVLHLITPAQLRHCDSKALCEMSQMSHLKKSKVKKVTTIKRGLHID